MLGTHRGQAQHPGPGQITGPGVVVPLEPAELDPPRTSWNSDPLSTRLRSPSRRRRLDGRPRGAARAVAVTQDPLRRDRDQRLRRPVDTVKPELRREVSHPGRPVGADVPAGRGSKRPFPLGPVESLEEPVHPPLMGRVRVPVRPPLIQMGAPRRLPPLVGRPQITLVPVRAPWPPGRLKG